MPELLCTRWHRRTQGAVSEYCRDLRNISETAGAAANLGNGLPMTRKIVIGQLTYELPSGYAKIAIENDHL